MGNAGKTFPKVFPTPFSKPFPKIKGIRGMLVRCSFVDRGCGLSRAPAPTGLCVERLNIGDDGGSKPRDHLETVCQRAREARTAALRVCGLNANDMATRKHCRDRRPAVAEGTPTCSRSEDIRRVLKERCFRKQYVYYLAGRAGACSRRVAQYRSHKQRGVGLSFLCEGFCGGVGAAFAKKPPHKTRPCSPINPR